MLTLGPNDLLPCGSDGARKRHLARAEHCDICGTEGRHFAPPSMQDIVERRRRLRELGGAA